MKATIRQAIEGRNVLSFVYHQRPRKIEPHVLGCNRGSDQVLGWQVGGHSSGNLPDWRRFNLHEIEQLRVLDETFAGPRRTFSVDRSRWDHITAVVHA